MKLYQLLIISCIYCWTIVAVLAVPFFNKHSSSTSSSSSSSSSSSHPSSLLLQHHRTIYTNRRPHDTSLYDILNVRPNATLVEIQKSWRRKSLLWHPDKVAARRRRQRNNDGVQKNDGRIDSTVVPPPPPPPPPASDDHSTGLNNKSSQQTNLEENDEEEYARNQLQKLQHAYEILSDDHNRLLYHKYGLIGGTDAAVQLLTGRTAAAVPSGSSTSLHNDGGVNNEGGVSAEQIRLLELMGYHHTQHHHQHHHAYPHSPSSTTTATISHQQRIQTLTTTITEYLRPLVEGTISQENFITQLHSEMNALKKSPLGAQIVRCVGRAYKVEGWRVLRSMREEKERYRGRKRTRRRGSGSSSRQKQNSRVDDILQDSWRSTKHYASAALASGKLVLMEQRLKKMEEDQLRERKERLRRKKEKEMMMRDEKEERVKRIESGGSDDHYLFSSNIGSLSDDTEDEEFDIGSFSDIDNNNDSDTDMMMFSSSESEEDDDDEIEYELQHIQNQKTYTALLSLHQMEALWKVTKIELDKTVREACRWILMPTTSPSSMNDGSAGEGKGGWYAFCPSEQSPYQEDWQHYHARPPPPPPPPPPPSSHHDEHERHHHHRRRHRRDRRHSEADGWVGLNGEVVPMEVGRLRAAAAMVLVGDIMVQCSKEGTAWRKNK